jgi:putative oxygen-independent coproporphyrinogen III oxidase
MVFTLRVPSQPQGSKPPVTGELPTPALESLKRRAFGIYLHVPFCAKRCGYCDFNTYTATELGGFKQSDWSDLILAELALAKKVLGEIPPIKTIFIGGGTPSLLAASEYEKVFAAISNNFAADIEITIEANPDSVSPASLKQYFAAGINRISFGMQSAAPNVLQLLDRTHDPKAVSSAVLAAKEVGFENISLDLIYGTPGESDENWLQSLQEATELPINHISAYSLIVEAGTKFANQVNRGEIPMPDDDLAAARYLIAEKFLTERNFQWYEISNWGINGASCRHNQLYWDSENWWGLGPGAHSHIGGVRWWNAKYPASWGEQLREGNSPAIGRELLTASEQQDERVMLGLRQRAGLAVAAVDRPEVLPELIAAGLLEPAALAQGRIVLTLQGRLLADRVTAQLLR